MIIIITHTQLPVILDVDMGTVLLQITVCAIMDGMVKAATQVS